MAPIVLADVNVAVLGVTVTVQDYVLVIAVSAVTLVGPLF